jgi:O-antigen ligase
VVVAALAVGALVLSLAVGAALAAGGSAYQKATIYAVALLVALLAGRMGPEWLAGLFLLSVPLQVLYSVGDTKLSVQELFLLLVFMYMLLGRFAASALNHDDLVVPEKPIAILSGLLIVAAVAQTASLGVAIDPDLSWQAWPTQVVFSTLVCLTFTLTARWARMPVVLLGAYILAGASYALLAIYAYVTGLSFDTVASTAAIVRAGGEGTLLPPSNLLGGALALALTVGVAMATLFSFPTRLLALPMLSVCTVGLILTYSRGSWIAAGAGVLVVLGFAAWRERARVVLVGLALCAVPLAALMIPGAEWQLRLEQLSPDYLAQDTGVLARFDWWDESYRLFLRSPLLGNGLDAYVKINPWGAHSHWLDLLAGVGLAGTLPVMGALLTTVACAVVALRSSQVSRSIVVMIVGSLAATCAFGIWTLGESVHSDRRMIAFVWAAVGMGIGAATRPREHSNKPA